MERLREVFTELEDSLLDAKALAGAISEHFPHRGINDVKWQLREVGLLSKKGRGKNDDDSAVEKSE